MVTIPTYYWVHFVPVYVNSIQDLEETRWAQSGKCQDCSLGHGKALRETHSTTF